MERRIVGLLAMALAALTGMLELAVPYRAPASSSPIELTTRDKASAGALRLDLVEARRALAYATR
jgi:hypothetical protein